MGERRSSRGHERSVNFSDRVGSVAATALSSAGVIPDVTSVESYRQKEKPKARLRRYESRVRSGRKNSQRTTERGRELNSSKPQRYDRQSYESDLTEAIDKVIVEAGEMPDEFYEIAGEAVAFINAKLGHENWSTTVDFFRDDPDGNEALAVLRSIVHTPSFIEKPQAERILAELGSASYHVCLDLFTHSDGYKTVRDMNEGYSKDSIAHLQRISDSDELWRNADYSIDEKKEAKWPLSAVAQALQVLSRKYPTETFDARINMLKRNEIINASGVIDLSLVFSFISREERAALEAIVARDTQEGSNSKVIPQILSGYYNKMAWAT